MKVWVLKHFRKIEFFNRLLHFFRINYFSEYDIHFSDLDIGCQTRKRCQGRKMSRSERMSRSEPPSFITRTFFYVIHVNKTYTCKHKTYLFFFSRISLCATFVLCATLVWAECNFGFRCVQLWLGCVQLWFGCVQLWFCCVQLWYVQLWCATLDDTPLLRLIIFIFHIQFCTVVVISKMFLVSFKL